ncbi:MAG: hypothetical protein ABR903_03760 [Thermodesulfovibrionales bacterium]
MEFLLSHILTAFFVIDICIHDEGLLWASAQKREPRSGFVLTRTAVNDLIPAVKQTTRVICMYQPLLNQKDRQQYEGEEI